MTLYKYSLNAHLDQTGLIPESQCGFRKDRGTIDMIFTARQLQEKCQEQNVDLYMTFVDLTKAFDTVIRDGLWKIMAKFGCPPRFIAMVRLCIKPVTEPDQTEPTEITELTRPNLRELPYVPGRTYGKCRYIDTEI